MEKEERRTAMKEAKGYLMQIWEHEVRIRQKQEQKEKLRIEVPGMRAIRYDQERVQTSSSGDMMEAYAEKLLRIQQEIMGEISEAEEKKQEIIEQINGLKSSYAVVLYKRYVEIKGLRLKSFERIAVEMDYSCDHVKHLHSRALIEFWQQYMGKK